MIKKALIVFVFLLTNAFSGEIDNIVNSMLKQDQTFNIVNTKKYGRSIISIGYANHSNRNIAYDIAKQEALKELAAFLNGESIKSQEVMKTAEKNGVFDESYYSKITSNISASIKSAFLFKSSKYAGEYYSVVLLSEKGSADVNFFKNKSNPNIIEARGFGSIKDGVSKGRQIALNSALRSAVEQFNGVQMASKTSIENADKYRGKLSSVSKGYVKKYEVIDEFKDKKTYTIVIVAEISKDEKGEQSIDAIKENMGRPSFFIQTNDNRIKDLVAGILSEQKLDLTNNKSQAKFVINAEVKIFEYDIPSLKGMKGAQTKITLSVIDKFAKEEIINIFNDQENSVDISKFKEVRLKNSYQYAIEDIKDSFIKSINNQFIHKFNNGNKVKVSLLNYDRMRDVDELKECIDSLSMVKSVNIVSTNKRSVVYDVIYLGNPSDLELEIIKKSREFRLRGLRVKKSDSSDILFKF